MVATIGHFIDNKPVAGKSEGPAQGRGGDDKSAANSGKAQEPEAGKVADGGKELPDEHEVQAGATGQGDSGDASDADAVGLLELHPELARRARDGTLSWHELAPAQL